MVHWCLRNGSFSDRIHLQLSNLNMHAHYYQLINYQVHGQIAIKISSRRNIRHGSSKDKGSSYKAKYDYELDEPKRIKISS